MASYYVYFARLKDGRIYTGHTSDVSRRQEEHRAGKGSRTAGILGVGEVLYSEAYPDRASAVRRERQLKGWSRAKKEALVAGDFPKLKKLASRRG